MQTHIQLALVVVIPAIGCGGTETKQAKSKKARPAPGVVLQVPEKLTIYSIDGTLEAQDAPYHKNPRELFHGYPVLGKTDVVDPAKRTEIIQAFGAALQNDKLWGECFWPRHAIQAVTNGKTADYVICYQCERVEISDPSGQTMKPTDSSSRAVLNKYLKEADVPLVKGAEGDDATRGR